MPNDDGKASTQSSNTQSSESIRRKDGPKQWLKTPAPIKRLFDKFPLQTLPPNDLPKQVETGGAKHVLYIFNTEDGAKKGAPSFNPSCLKWQAYLRFSDVDFATIASNNHASPTGALPFLSTFKLPLDPLEPPTVISSTKLERWLQSQGVAREEPESMRYEAYMALLDHRIRDAWLYALYMTPSNFHSVAERLYIEPASSNGFVRLALSYQLRQAARAELLKYFTIIDVEALFREAERAWAALSEQLGDDAYFFSQEKPGLFDANVFAYTHLLLDGSMGWSDTRIQSGLKDCKNLLEHRERLLRLYF